MSLYSDIIKRRYENDSALVKRADDSLYNNNPLSNHEKKDCFQMSIDYVLKKYGIISAWIHGIKDPEDLLEAKLNPYGLMYKKIDVSDHENILRHGGYIIAFGDDGDVYVLKSEDNFNVNKHSNSATCRAKYTDEEMAIIGNLELGRNEAARRLKELGYNICPSTVSNVRKRLQTAKEKEYEEKQRTRYVGPLGF